MDNFNAVTQITEIVPQALSDCDGSVLPAGAADADRQVAFQLFSVLRKQVGNEVTKLRVEGLVTRLLLQIVDHFTIQSGLRAQGVDKVGVRQEPHIEQQVEAIRQAVFEAEGDDGHEHGRLDTREAEPAHHLGLQLVYGELRRIEHHVGQRLHLGERGALALNRLQNRQIGAQRVRAPRLRISAGQNLVGRLEENQDDIGHKLLNAILVETGKDLGEVVSADVDDDPNPAGLFVRSDFFEEGLEKLDRKIVAAVEAEIFERRLDVALPRAGETGDDDEILRAS